MKLITIRANSAAEALAEIHRKLGPKAVIVNVRKTPAPGIGGIFKKSQIEVQAGLPDQEPARPKKSDWAELHKKVTELKEQFANAAPEEPVRAPNPRDRLPNSDLKRPVSRPETHSDYPSRVRESLREARERSRGEIANASKAAVDGPLNLAQLLESVGFLPLHAQWLVEQVRKRRGSRTFVNLRHEFEAVQEFLTEYWSQLSSRIRLESIDGVAPARILVGAPGVGKTTCLCKWLTQEVLVHAQAARVWRLDTHSANTAEFLSIHGEILGVPVERVWTQERADDPVQFVDLPGVPIEDGESINALSKVISEFRPATLFLVLNAAYDLDHLFSQIRAFSPLKPAALILTHVDEETRWSKFWNLFLAAQLPMAFLSGGQNIPGNFSPATPAMLFDPV